MIRHYMELGFLSKKQNKCIIEVNLGKNPSTSLYYNFDCCGSRRSLAIEMKSIWSHIILFFLFPFFIDQIQLFCL